MRVCEAVLEEGDRINVYDHPNPATVKYRRMIGQKPADKLVQGIGMCAFQKKLPSISAGDFDQGGFNRSQNVNGIKSRWF